MSERKRVDPDKRGLGCGGTERNRGRNHNHEKYEKKYFLNSCFSHTMHLFSIKGEHKFKKNRKVGVALNKSIDLFVY